MIAGRFLLVYFLTAVIDYLVFFVTLRLTGGSVLAAQVAGRFFSVPFNYLMVRGKVFRSDAPHVTAGPKFLILYATAFFAAWGMIEGLRDLIPLGNSEARVIVAKMIAEGSILVVKFFVQRHLIFQTAGAAAVCILLSGAPAYAQSMRDVAPVTPLQNGETLVVGMLGGFERWNDPNRGVRKLALKLRDTPGIAAESFSNRRRRTAMQYVLKRLDANQNGALEDEEKSRARLILYGQSLGGAQVVAMARDLNKRGIPVLLTVQVDSFGLRDDAIPPNVRAAANFYQHEILTFRGQTRIHAVDPSKTRVLANVQFHYPLLLPSYSRPESWARRRLGGAHAKLEADPILWAQIETMVREAVAGARTR